MTKNKFMEIMGHRIDLSKIENPHLLEVINLRTRCGDFRFYGDHGQYKEEISPRKHRERYEEHDQYEVYKERKKWDDIDYYPEYGG